MSVIDKRAHIYEKEKRCIVISYQSTSPWWWPYKCYSEDFHRGSTYACLSSFYLVEDTGVPGEHHRPVTSQWQTVSHNVVSSTLLVKVRQRLKLIERIQHNTLPTSSPIYNRSPVCLSSKHNPSANSIGWNQDHPI